MIARFNIIYIYIYIYTDRSYHKIAYFIYKITYIKTQLKQQNFRYNYKYPNYIFSLQVEKFIILL